MKYALSNDSIYLNYIQNFKQVFIQPSSTKLDVCTINEKRWSSPLDQQQHATRQSQLVTSLLGLIKQAYSRETAVDIKLSELKLKVLKPLFKD